MMNFENKVQEMINLLNEAKVDAGKFDKNGNKAAGTRLRKAMQDIKGMAQDIRVAVSEAKNAE